MNEPTIAIADFDMGNLFSVRQACILSGLRAELADSPEALLSADALILPGVGAFADAMKILKGKGMDTAIREFVSTGKPLLAICLGMQLLMDRSHEFGLNDGLGIIRGEVKRIPDNMGNKVPQVGWNRLWKTEEGAEDAWEGSLLSGLPDGMFMYFVHSFHVAPEDLSIELANTEYGSLRFCSAMKLNNIQAFQGHPEKSGPSGLKIYRNFANIIKAHQA